MKWVEHGVAREQLEKLDQGDQASSRRWTGRPWSRPAFFGTANNRQPECVSTLLARALLSSLRAQRWRTPLFVSLSVISHSLICFILPAPTDISRDGYRLLKHDYGGAQSQRRVSFQHLPSVRLLAHLQGSQANVSVSSKDSRRNTAPDLTHHTISISRSHHRHRAAASAQTRNPAQRKYYSIPPIHTTIHLATTHPHHPTSRAPARLRSYGLSPDVGNRRCCRNH